jgi:hypothetical protein
MVAAIFHAHLGTLTAGGCDSASHPRNSETPEREVVDYVLKAPDAGSRRDRTRRRTRGAGVWHDAATWNAR